MIGIVCALFKEGELLIETLQEKKLTKVGHMDFWNGTLFENEVTISICGMGKVNAALGTQLLITQFGCKKIISSGIAGGAKDHVKIGDIVITSKCFEHDFDLSPIGYEKCFIPSVDVKFFELNMDFTSIIDTYFANMYKIGMVATGDQFINSTEFAKKLNREFGNVAFEMECAAIAHTCHLHNIPFFNIEVICDYADDNSHQTINTTIDDCCKRGQEVVLKIFEEMK